MAATRGGSAAPTRGGARQRGKSQVQWNDAGKMQSVGQLQRTGGRKEHSKPTHSKPTPKPEEQGKDRFEWLKEQRKRERAQAIADGLLHDPGKKRTLETAITPVGTCEDMCPEFERVERVQRHEVDRCEKTQPDDGEPAVPAAERMVKKFVRSDAGREEQLPSDIRTPDALVRTMDYLIEDVVGKEERLIACHNFVWDRTRALRSGDRFDAQQDVEQLNKTFTSLWHYYDTHRGAIALPNEAEFRSYQILFEILSATPDLEDRMHSWPYDVLADARVQTALRLYQFATDTLRPRGPLQPLTPDMVAQMNACAFWDLLASPSCSYLMACVAEMSFYLVRFGFLTVLWKSVKSAPKAQQERMKEWTVGQMREYLSFDVDAQVEQFCAGLGIDFHGTNDNGENYLDFSRDSALALELDNVPRKQIFSKTLVEVKRLHRNYVALIDGKTAAEAIEADEVMEEDGTQQRHAKSDEEHSMFFPETSTISAGPAFGSPQPQEPQSGPTPDFGSGMFNSGLSPTATPFEIAPRQGKLLFGKAPSNDGKNTGIVFLPPNGSNTSKQSDSSSTLFNNFRPSSPLAASSTPKLSTVDPSALFNSNKLSSSTQYPPTKNIFGQLPTLAGEPTQAQPLKATGSDLEGNQNSLQTSASLPPSTSESAKLFTWPLPPKPEHSEPIPAPRQVPKFEHAQPLQQPFLPWASPHLEVNKEQDPPRAESPRTVAPTVNFSTTATRSASPRAPKTLDLPSATQQRSSQSEVTPTPAFNPQPPESRPGQPSPQKPAFDFKSASPNSPTLTPSSSVKRITPPLSTTPPSSPPISVAGKQQDLIAHTARLALTQPNGLLYEFLEYTLENILPSIMEQHVANAFAQTLAQLKAKILRRKFGPLWRKLAYEKSLNRRAAERRRRFAQSLKMEADKKRKRDDDLHDIMAAMEDNKRIRAEQERVKKAAEKAKSDHEAKATKFRQERAQVGETRKKSSGIAVSTDLQPPIRAAADPLRHHKRARSSGAPMPPPPRPSQPTPCADFRASIFSAGNSSITKLSRSRSLRESQRSRSDIRSHQQDHTHTDFFRLLAHNVDPETPLIPLTQAQIDAKAKKEKEKRDARLSAMYNRRKVGHTTTPLQLSPPPTQASSAPHTPSTRDSTLFDPDSDDLIRQIRETKEMLAEGSGWFKEQTSAFYKEEQEEQEEREEQHASFQTTNSTNQTSPHVSINGVDYAPVPGPSMSRAERLIRSYGLDKPKPKYGIDSFAAPLSQQTVARSQIGPLDKAANSTARKRKERSSLPDPRFDPDQAGDYAGDYAYAEISHKHSNPRARPNSSVSINNNNPYSHLQRDQDDDEEELYEDTEELASCSTGPGTTKEDAIALSDSD
ncbi:hypothetical protein DV736_g1339, partial [Chaetothyriales sp. CBS 134916]